MPEGYYINNLREEDACAGILAGNLVLRVSNGQTWPMIMLRLIQLNIVEALPLYDSMNDLKEAIGEDEFNRAFDAGEISQMLARRYGAHGTILRSRPYLIKHKLTIHRYGNHYGWRDTNDETHVLGAGKIYIFNNINKSIEEVYNNKYLYFLKENEPT